MGNRLFPVFYVFCISLPSLSARKESQTNELASTHPRPHSLVLHARSRLASRFPRREQPRSVDGKFMRVIFSLFAEHVSVVI